MSSDEMTNVDVRCPICTKKGYIEVNLTELRKIERGLLAINVAENTVCEHTFIAYVDKNLNVRDCYIADFTLDVVQEAASIEDKSALIEEINLDTIKMYFNEGLIAGLLRALLLKKSVLVISNQTQLANYVHNFFDYITENSFDYDITFKEREEYLKNKKEYKKHVVFQGNTLHQDKKKIIDQKKMKYETRIVHKFFEETDLLSSLIIFKNEIQKIYELANSLGKIIKDNEGKQLNSKFLISELKNVQEEKITSVELELLLDIVRNYFEISFSKLSDASDFLGFL